MAKTTAMPTAPCKQEKSLNTGRFDLKTCFLCCLHHYVRRLLFGFRLFTSDGGPQFCGVLDIMLFCDARLVCCFRRSGRVGTIFPWRHENSNEILACNKSNAGRRWARQISDASLILLHFRVTRLLALSHPQSDLFISCQIN